MVEKKVSTTLLADYLFFIKHALMLKSSMVDQIHFSVKSRAIINKKETPFDQTFKIPPTNEDGFVRL